MTGGGDPDTLTVENRLTAADNADSDDFDHRR